MKNNNKKLKIVAFVVIFILIFFIIGIILNVSENNNQKQKKLILSEEDREYFESMRGKNAIIDTRRLYDLMDDEKTFKLIRNSYEGKELKTQLQSYKDFIKLTNGENFKGSDEEKILTLTFINNKLFNEFSDKIDFTKMMNYYENLVELNTK